MNLMTDILYGFEHVAPNHLVLYPGKARQRSPFR